MATRTKTTTVAELKNVVDGVAKVLSSNEFHRGVPGWGYRISARMDNGMVKYFSLLFREVNGTLMTTVKEI